MGILVTGSNSSIAKSGVGKVEDLEVIPATSIEVYKNIIKTLNILIKDYKERYSLE